MSEIHDIGADMNDTSLAAKYGNDDRSQSIHNPHDGPTDARPDDFADYWTGIECDRLIICGTCQGEHHEHRNQA